MPHGFEFYNVFISAPGDLEADRQACYDAVAEANETTAMAAKVLLAAVGLRENGQIGEYRSIVSDNVRWSSYYLQLFQDDWGTRDLFRKLFLVAVECRDDASMPMRNIVVGVKDAPNETNEEILAWRRELEQRSDMLVFRYATVDELKARLKEVCEGWARDAVARTPVADVPSPEIAL